MELSFIYFDEDYLPAMTQNILVTGATGFIGEAFVNALNIKKENYNIFCAVRITSNIDSLKHLNVKFVEFDLTDPKCFPLVTKGMDIVVHFAALYNFHGSKEQLYKHNFEATRDLAEACLKNKVKHFIYCSTTEVLGIIQNGSEESECKPDFHLGYYGASKLAAEKTLLEIYHENQLPITIVRPTGVIGPGNCYPFNELIESLDKNALNAKIFPGSGNHTVHWSYLDDIVQGFILILENSEKTIGEIFNLASDEPQTYKEIFTVIAETLGKKPPRFISFFPIFIGKVIWPVIHNYYKLKGLDIFPFKPGSLDNTTISRSYSNKKAKEILGFNPQINFKLGVERTIEWMREQGLLNN